MGYYKEMATMRMCQQAYDNMEPPDVPEDYADEDETEEELDAEQDNI